MHILGIAGSLRERSYNLALLRAVDDLLPAHTTFSIAHINDIPPFNEDLEAKGIPAAVQDLRMHVSNTDALLISTPEYNHAIPGVLKNAIDWLSRADSTRHRPLTKKPLAITGVTPGGFGTVHAQTDLRKLGATLDMAVLNKPELLISHAKSLFEDGILTDHDTKQKLQELLHALIEWTQQLNKDR